MENLVNYLLLWLLDVVCKVELERLEQRWEPEPCDTWIFTGVEERIDAELMPELHKCMKLLPCLKSYLALSVSCRVAELDYPDDGIEIVVIVLTFCCWVLTFLACAKVVLEYICWLYTTLRRLGLLHYLVAFIVLDQNFFSLKLKLLYRKCYSNAKKSCFTGIA